MILESSNPCDTIYVSGACNSNPSSADWGENDTICVAINEAVAILKPDNNKDAPGKIKKTFLAHSSRVNVVKWVVSLENIVPNAFISADVNGAAIVWILNEHDDYTPKFVLKGHTESVTDVCAISLKWQDINYMLAVTLSMDTLKIWKKNENDDEFCCFFSVDHPEVGLGVSGLSFALLPNTSTLIFASCKKFVDISLHTCPLSSLSDDEVPRFEEAAVLSGHTNWINDLSFTTCGEGNNLLLASASHDCTIRIWRISRQVQSQNELKLRELTISADNEQFSVTLYSILHGHDQWVYTVRWKHFDSEGKEENKLKLLSVSADKTAIVWQQDLSLNTWIETYRLGDVGGNAAGFLGGCFDPSGQFVMVHDLIGAFHVWIYDENKDIWLPSVLPSGHYDAVNDIQWDPKGQFLVSVSSDKTTRLHAPWRTNSSYWYEFARPQTHGHTIFCVAVLPQSRFVSGASEKELRSFIATRNFLLNFKEVSYLENLDVNKFPHNTAMLPSLDLSNKPAVEVENINIDTIYCNRRNGMAFPTEEELARNTLWPEIQKLYYHPNEIASLASSSDGTLLASACKANSPKEAAIAVWSVKWDNIERIQELWFHQLTVTQLAFSPNGLYLLSVSRDRTWHLFKKKDQEDTFESVAFATKTNTAHKRQLQSCAWSHDSLYFATGSRDGKMVIWSRRLDGAGEPTPDESTFKEFGCRYTLTVANENICSIAFAPSFINSREYLIAIGFGSGKIGLYVWNNTTCQHWLTLEKDSAHHKEVTRLVFRPIISSQDQSRSTNKIQLASAGLDRLVKIHELNVSSIQCT